MSTQPINPSAVVAPSIIGIKASKNGHSKRKTAAPVVPVASVQPEPEHEAKSPSPESMRDPIAKSLRESKIEYFANALRSRFITDSTIDFLNEVIVHCDSDSIELTPAELIRCFNEIAEDHKPKAEKLEEAEDNPALAELEKSASWKLANYYANGICENVQHSIGWLKKAVHEDQKFSTSEELSEILSDLSTLHLITEIWRNSDCRDDYPTETRMNGSIKYVLDL